MRAAVLLLALAAGVGAQDTEYPCCYSMATHVCTAGGTEADCTGMWLTEESGGDGHDHGDEDHSSDEPETFPEMHGFTPSSDVVSHSNIDLDQAELEGFLGQGDADGYAAAALIYNQGKNSIKGGSGAIRTLAGFSTGLHAKARSADGEALYEMYNTYYGKFPIEQTDAALTPDADGQVDETQYGHKLVMAALGYDPTVAYDATPVATTDGPYKDLDYAAKKDLAKKSTVYTVSWMYVVHELEDAIDDCLADNVFSNDVGQSGAYPKAWDEGWAFWVGSLGTKMTYTLAEKRGGNFGTEDADGTISNVNANLIEMYNEGANLLNQGRCNELTPLVKAMEVQMTVPILQGMLKYVYELGYPGPKRYPGLDQTFKASGEAWAFAAGVLPQIDNCSPELAASFREELDLYHVEECPITLAVTGNADDGWFGDQVEPAKEKWAMLYEGIQGIYSCLGIKCSDMGGYLDGVGGFLEGFEACTDATPNLRGGAEEEAEEKEKDGAAKAMAMGGTLAAALLML